METTPFFIQMQVRDYECDMADGVNNSVYMNYLEHCRHEYLKKIGIDFADYSRRKIGLIIIRAEIDYKWSLVSGNEFNVSVEMERVSRLRFSFNQQIHLLPERKLVLAAKIIGTVIDSQGRPRIPAELENILSQSTLLRS